MKRRNRTGPKTDPWGTPDSTGTGSEAWLEKKLLTFYKTILQFANDMIWIQRDRLRKNVVLFFLHQDWGLVSLLREGAIFQR